MSFFRIPQENKFSNGINQVLSAGDSLLSPLKRVSLAQQGLTSLFGMGRGVTLATNHQH